MSQRSFLISGAGSGIGRAAAITLSQRGDRLFLLGRTQKKLEETKKELQGNNHEVIVADITDRSVLNKAINGIEGLDGAIANAGQCAENVYGENDTWADILNTNLTGSYYFSREAYPLLKKQLGHKHLIFISSILARMGLPNYNAYCASKAGMLGLMRSLAMEWAPNKILVNAICPGWVDTAMGRDGINSYAAHTGKTYDEAFNEQMSYLPLNKMSEPSEIGRFIAYLSGSDQISITGQSLDINNGALMPC